jgi:hypothetical protein
MSFSESLFSAGLFQKTTKRDLFVKGKFRIKIQHICEKTLEDFWSILLLPPRMHLSHTSSRFDPRAHVGHPGLYKETVAPLEGIKSSSHLEIKPSRARNPNSLEFQ